MHTCHPNVPNILADRFFLILLLLKLKAKKKKISLVKNTSSILKRHDFI